MENNFYSKIIIALINGIEYILKNFKFKFKKLKWGKG